MNCQCNCHSNGSQPIEILKSEHRVIEGVLKAAECMLVGGRIERDFFAGFIDFVRHFADGCHHAKEEERLFPALEQAGVPREGGPIGVMLYEHDLGRQLIRRIEANLDTAANGDRAAREQVQQAAAHYIRLLRDHIAKEDNVLFVMADQILGATDKLALGAAFEQIEHTPENEGKHERYLRLADALHARAFGTECVGVA